MESGDALALATTLLDRQRANEEEEQEDDDDEEEYVEKEGDASMAASKKEEPLEGPAYEGLTAEDLEWMRRLAKWTRCFSEVLIKWGVVDKEGKRRRGVVVTLVANVTAWNYDGKAKPLQLLRLREAIDLMRVVALAKPAVLKAVVRRLEGDCVTSVPPFSAYEDELNALTRGVPVDIKVVLIHGGLKTLGLKQRMSAFFIRKLSETASTNAEFVAAWAELLALASDRLGLVECNVRLKAPVRTTFLIDSSESCGAAQWESEQFFHHIIKFARAVHSDNEKHGAKV